MILTYKEFEKQRDKKCPSNIEKKIEKNKEIKEEIKVIRDKWYYLRHPDYPVVADCIYVLDEKYELQIDENGCIIVDNEEIRDRLMENNFYLAGIKNKEDE